MAQVVTIAQSVRDLAGGLDHFEVEAANVRQLLDELDARHPGLAAHVREQMMVAIDGELHHEPWNEPLARNAHVVFIPAIGGG